MSKLRFEFIWTKLFLTVGEVVLQVCLQPGSSIGQSTVLRSEHCLLFHYHYFLRVCVSFIFPSSYLVFDKTRCFMWPPSCGGGQRRVAGRDPLPVWPVSELRPCGLPLVCLDGLGPGGPAFMLARLTLPPLWDLPRNGIPLSTMAPQFSTLNDTGHTSINLAWQKWLPNKGVNVLHWAELSQ